MNPVLDLRLRRGLTQSQLAELARTSQPTIAAYEAERKSPSLQTLERLAHSAGLEVVLDFVAPLTREDRRSLALHRAIARRLEQAPEPTLRSARKTLARMRRQHPGARALLSRWHGILRLSVPEIVEVLRDPRPSARELRQVTPFAGILTAPERALVYQRFAKELEGRR